MNTSPLDSVWEHVARSKPFTIALRLAPLVIIVAPSNQPTDFRGTIAVKNSTSILSISLVVTIVATLGLAAISCGGDPKYVRDTDEPRLDEYTMSLRFDRRDLDRLYQDTIHHLLNSSIARTWDNESSNVAIFPMRNETSEHIENQLETLLSRYETDLVNRTGANVISHRDQPELIAEVQAQQSQAYDPSQVTHFGRQMGAQYFITGRVYDVAERVEDQRRVQYFLFTQVVNVETGQIHFQHESEITKGLIR